MEIAKIYPDLQIAFSPKVKKWLRSQSELAVFLQRDTLVLKKVALPKLSALAKRSPKEEMPLTAIVKEVHRYRKEKKQRGRAING